MVASGGMKPWALWRLKRNLSAFLKISRKRSISCSFSKCSFLKTSYHHNLSNAPISKLNGTLFPNNGIQSNLIYSWIWHFAQYFLLSMLRTKVLQIKYSKWKINISQLYNKNEVNKILLNNFPKQTRQSVSSNYLCLT